MRKRIIGIVVSILVVITAFYGAQTLGLEGKGLVALCAMLFTVTWWAFQVIPPAYTALLLVLFFTTSGTAPPETVFNYWISPLAWLMIGAFLIARAVSQSGLARRLALLLMIHRVRTHTQLVIAIYLLNIVLALIIPIPFPRAFIIMALVREVIERSGIPKPTARALGYAVFAACMPASLMFLTGEAILNPVTAAFAGGASWGQWLVMMFLPSLLIAVLMASAHFLVFPGSGKLELPLDHLRGELEEMGTLTRAEIGTMAWTAFALVMWMTDSIHGVHPGWVALGVAVGLALPWIGDILGGDDITAGVDWSALMFGTGALALGAVGEETGLSRWLVATFIPDMAGNSTLMILIVVALAGYFMHLLLGSALVTLSMLAPPMVSLAVDAGINPLVPALLILTTSVMGVALPYHNLMILVGTGKTGGFDTRETMKFFPALTGITAIAVAFQIIYWTLIGVI
ncbi:MAG: anion permease [Bacillota bacterium]